jgi:hypothetical protein
VGPTVGEGNFSTDLALIPAWFAFLMDCGRIGKLNNKKEQQKWTTGQL